MEKDEKPASMRWISIPLRVENVVVEERIHVEARFLGLHLWGGEIRLHVIEPGEKYGWFPCPVYVLRSDLKCDPVFLHGSRFRLLGSVQSDVGGRCVVRHVFLDGDQWSRNQGVQCVLGSLEVNLNPEG
jgi:hypothetical protein